MHGVARLCPYMELTHANYYIPAGCATATLLTRPFLSFWVGGAGTRDYVLSSQVLDSFCYTPIGLRIQSLYILVTNTDMYSKMGLTYCMGLLCCIAHTKPIGQCACRPCIIYMSCDYNLIGARTRKYDQTLSLFLGRRDCTVPGAVYHACINRSPKVSIACACLWIFQVPRYRPVYWRIQKISR